VYLQFFNRIAYTLLATVMALMASNALALDTVAEIAAPPGFSRTVVNHDSFQTFARGLPVKHDNRVKLWNGDYLPSEYYNTLAVLDLPLLFNEDLEQCADFSMRLWAEYLKSIDKLDQLSLFDFYGHKRAFKDSNKSFKDYLRWHMAYSNSYSVKRGAKEVALSDLQAGDMFVQNDSKEGIGHVSMVIDEAVNKFGLKVYLVGYSFMPAQEFHLERADESRGFSGWFTAQGYQDYANAVFGNFGKASVMRYELAQ